MNLAFPGQLQLILHGCGRFYMALDGSVRFRMLLAFSRP